jgi:hypothetical protein
VFLALTGAWMSTSKKSMNLFNKDLLCEVSIYSSLLLMFLGTAIEIGNPGGFLGFPVLLIASG